jgi:dTMP kinase
VRGVDSDWVQGVYRMALVPDAIFYLDVPPKVLAERNFRKSGLLDYWESGMDIRRSGDMYECFLRYQRRMRRVFLAMKRYYRFEVVDGNRPPAEIAGDLRTRVQRILQDGTVALPPHP